MDQKPWILDCGHKHIFPYNIEQKDFKCPTLVRAILPCGHESTQKPCHRDINEWSCGFPCDVRVEPCGHSCRRPCHFNDDPDHIQYKCHKPCWRVPMGCSTETHKCPKLCHEYCPPCEVIVKKKLSNCNHKHDVRCSKSVNGIVCNEPCEKKIPSCGHVCKLKCYEPCDGSVKRDMKTIALATNKYFRHARREIFLHEQRNMKPPQCRQLVEHTKPAYCGHKFKIECHLQTQQLPNYSNTLLQFCTAPCTAVLDCKHKCSGTCGECAQGRIHTTCMEKCGVTLICGHECKKPCSEVCQPCPLKCVLKCIHSRCSKLCGEVCTKCSEDCARRCKHMECTSKCGDMCNVPPCKEPCEKMLPCSHPCVGFCGDPCPPLCRICDEEKISEIFLGFEDEIDARFVLLEECGHVIESQGMDIYCEQNGGGGKGINYRSCPWCRTPLTSTQRYSDYVKQAIKDVAAVKQVSGASPREIEAKRQELHMKLHTIKLLKQGRVFSTSKGFDKFINDCDALLQPVNKNRRQGFDLMIGKILEAKVTIVQGIGDILNTNNLNVGRSTTRVDNDVLLEATSYVEYLFKRLTTQVERITNQEISDFKREQERLQSIAQFVNITESSPRSSDHKELRELIYRPIIYNENYDKIVKVKLEEFLKKMGIAASLTDLQRPEKSRLKKGHWYKCPNGHIYAIGYCGGANQINRCNECWVQLG